MNSIEAWRERQKEESERQDEVSPPIQVGGNHYERFSIQPIDFIVYNDIPFNEANVIKYVVRHSFKNGLEDLKKAKQYLEFIASYQYGEEI